MQTSLHILGLIEELKRELIGGRIVNTEFYKKERSAYFFIKSKSGLWGLGFVFHPAGAGFFCVPASKIKVETREKPWPVFDLAGAAVAGVSQVGLDRIFAIDLAEDNRRILFEALGPNGNVWLLDAASHALATLRKRDLNPGEKHVATPQPDRLNPFELTASDPKALFAGCDAALPLILFLEKQVAGFNRTLARETARRANLEHLHIGDLSDQQLLTLVTTIGDLAARFREPSAAYLHQVAGHLEAYPFKLTIVDEAPEKFKTLSLAIMALCERRQNRVEEADERKSTLDLVHRAIHKLERRLEHVEKDVAEASDFEQFKRLGELLQTNFNRIKRGMSSLTVRDLMHPEGDEVTIPLDPALSPKENTEAFFKRHRKGREGLALLQRRLEISRAELADLRELEHQLNENFDQAILRHAAAITALRPHTTERGEPAPRLPYREYRLSTGLTILVGRDGSDNDRTTFDFARPYELWFHASQCPGSHVVIRFPNKSFQPSKAEIEETAAIAAFFSKAKNDTLVPVAYTERRYVRKPRNAKPGLVVIEREKSVMVHPKKPD